MKLTRLDPCVRALLKSVKPFAKEVRLRRHDELAEVTATDGYVLAVRYDETATDLPAGIEFYLDADTMAAMLACPASAEVYLYLDESGATRLRIEMIGDSAFPDVAGVIPPKPDVEPDSDAAVDVVVARRWLMQALRHARAGSIVELALHDRWIDVVAYGDHERLLDKVFTSRDCKLARLHFYAQRLKRALAPMRGTYVRIYQPREGAPVIIYDNTGVTVIQQTIPR